MSHWYAVRCKPRQEAVAQENLARQGFDVYLPRLRTTRRRCGKWVACIEALFPSYLFLRNDPSRQSMASVRSTRGAIDLVRLGGQPAVVPDTIIVNIQSREESASGLRQDDRSPIQTGDPVRVVDGPLAGLEGVFRQQDGERRVIVLLELLGKAHSMALSLDWVARAA